MKKVLLSFLLIGSVSTLFAQATNNFPCPNRISSNQGGGDCKECTSSTTGQLPNVPDADFSKSTAKVILNFGAQTPSCIPRLLRLRDKTGETRNLLCGLGNVKNNGTNDLIVEYCLFGDNNENFFNQPDLVAVLQYECGGEPVVIACSSEGENVPLPVTFKSFTVSRQSGSNVNLTWTTASEQSNKGFFVQRNDGSGWKNVSFVFSQASEGNSASDLSYQFNDVNNENGISQYRIQQVDLNGASRFSEIKAIRGQGVSTKLIVYPNPSSNGRVNLVFEDNTSIRDVQVSDASGRLINQFKGITNNILVLENLRSGFYSIKVTNRKTAVTSVEKVVVK